MAYHSGASHSPWECYKTENGSSQHNAQTPLEVAPLSCIPPPGNAPSSMTFGGLPAMVFLTSQPTDDEWNNIVAATRSGVALTGSAALGKPGPVIGSVDIAESVDEYLFRVSLPGVVRDDKSFTCDVHPDGQIIIKGVTSTGEKTVCKNSMVFKMQTHNLSPPGDFSISFQLPGPVQYQQMITVFGSGGIFEGLVRKRLRVGP